MKQNYTIRTTIVLLLTSFFSLQLFAQQLPNASFEDWSGEPFNGSPQPASWNASNVSQVGVKFNFAYKETGHTGSFSMMVKDQEVGAMGITEVAPGYFSLGKPWSYLEGISPSTATAGTEGGMQFAYRPDTMQVWIRRTGNNVGKEDFYLLYYSWSGTAKGVKYAAKGGGATATNRTNEESDIRQALDKNEVAGGTVQYANQIAEGMVREKKEYAEWTLMNVPVYYLNNDTPEMCNIIFSAGNYPNFRANSGLYAGNALYVDDVKLIYSSKIQHLYIGNKEWKGFDPNSTEEQIYSVGNATEIPDIYATRGEGVLSNARGDQANFPGRRLTDNEISIRKGTIDGEPTLITVTAEDRSSTTTYKVRFISKPSDNARLSGIQVNGVAINGFNGYVNSYDIPLPYGTTEIPVLTYTKAEDGQTVTLSPPTSTQCTATIKVVAPDGTTTFTYTLRFYVADLADNTLKDIQVNGESVSGFQPSQTIYKVELPLGTTTMPEVKAVSAYPDGAQTIKYTAPSQIDGGQYQIAVTTPGNATPKVYKLNFKITASTNSSLKDLQVAGGYITGFDANVLTYYVELPLGTIALPEITWTPGDKYQTITKEEGGIDGTTRITVTAASGEQTVYKIVFSTLKSEISSLNNIYIDGVALEGFAADRTTYDYQLPIGTTSLPAITFDKGDDYQTVTVRQGGIDGTTRIMVTAGNGTTTIYQINFSVLKANDATLKMIYVDGEPLTGYDPKQLEYTVSLPQGATDVPVITWEQNDEWQTVTSRPATSLTTDYKITVRPQEGASQTYILRFSVATSSNTDLAMIYLDGEPLADFSPELTAYTHTLPMGVSTIPAVTYDKAESSQQVLSIFDHEQQTLRVTAESGASKTYTITFIIQKSENAFLSMIYLDGQPLPDFESDRLSGYTVVLQGTACPAITVDKAAGQQVTIVAPVLEGEARIRVTPEQGAANTYIIEFVKEKETQLLLADILLDGESMEQFDAQQTDYTLTYETALPVVTYKQMNAQQTIAVMQDKDTVRLLVNYGEDRNTYTLRFNKQLSATTALNKIWLDAVPLEEYNYETAVSETTHTTTYTVYLPAGSTLPVVTYEKADLTQQVVAGQTDENTVRLTVTAEDGTRQYYIIDFDIALYDDATLQSIMLDGIPLEGFDKHTFTYELTKEKGAALPVLTYRKNEGTATVTTATSAASQQIIVVAQSGATNTYTLNYRVVHSSNALLKDILLNGKRLPDFQSDKFHYIDTLAWRTAVVPAVQPISAIAGQTVSIEYAPVNATTRIHVVAEDGLTEAVYTIQFPVRRSSNTKLESVFFRDLDFEFDEDITEYTVRLPYQTDTVPYMTYEKQEPEQQVRYLSAPVNDTTLLVVTAENGDKRIYRFAFEPTFSDKENRLASILVNGEAVDMTAAAMTDEEHIYLAVPMPYGTTAFAVACLKNYDEQSYIIQQGGLYHPTVITLKANRPDEADMVYTIMPQVATQSPAVLQSLSVNNQPLADFDKNRFAYVANVASTSSMPIVAYTQNSGVQVQVTEQNDKRWIAQVSADGFTNTYTIYYHYPADVIPNGEFTNWTKAKYNDADKPSDWQVAADYADKYSFPAAYTGKEITNGDNGIVAMKTHNLSTALDWGGGGIPSIITLGQLQFSWGTSGNTTSKVDPSSKIPFKNTPDAVAIRYWHKAKSGNGPLFSFRFFYNTTDNIVSEYATSETTSDYIVYTQPLATDGLDVNAMNIVVNATNQEKGVKKGAELYLDYLRFVYNSHLSSIMVNGEASVLSNTTFTCRLDDAEKVGIPHIELIGEVSDQARIITWAEEQQQGAEALRKATIRNVAEDGTYTDYTLEVIRPLSQVNFLRSIEIDGVQIDGFDRATLSYTYMQKAGTTRLPDIVAVPATDLQTVSIAQTEEGVAITVTPEYGEAQTYTIAFRQDLSSDVTLRSLTAEGIAYTPEQTEYTIEASTMPTVTFVKQSDWQTVELDNGILTVTAEDGTQGQYTITLQPAPVTTSGQLSMITVDDIDIEGFSKDQYRYEHEASDLMGFLREYPTDSVWQLITPDSVQWKVFGTEQHTYTVVYPTHLSADYHLSSIMLDGEPYEEFVPEQSNYVIMSDEVMDIDVLPADLYQTVDLQFNGAVCTIQVTAADGTVRPEPYTIEFRPETSAQATLQMIRLDGVDLPEFQPDRLTYTVVLPTANPKLAEPQMPSVSYVLGQEAQTVQVEPALLGNTTYLTVTSEDGTQQLQYELTIQAEPSHNATLNNISLDGIPLKRFAADRYYYSVQIQGKEPEILYSAEDKFQTVSISLTEDNIYLVHVVAQDGITANDYEIEVWEESLSNNAFLQDIRLNSLPFSEYDSKADDFTPKQLCYNIALQGNSVLQPDIYVQLAEDGQQWTLLQGNDIDTVRVVAPDGFTANDYILNFLREKSSNTDLQMIFLNGTPLPDYDKQTTVYNVNLPVGTESMPNVDVQKAESVQEVTTTWQGNTVLYTVTAEDGTAKVYELNFHFLLSEADTLLMIYEDGMEMQQFSPDRFYYSSQLPVGVRQLPTLTYDAADRWQAITTDTIQSGNFTTYQFAVLAESGKKNVYTVVYELQYSAVDTLQMILVNGQELEDFAPDRTEYTCLLPAGTTETPQIDYITGDKYQTVEITNGGVDGVTQIIVTAENGNKNTYNIRFSTALSDNAHLKMIAVAGKDIANFDGEVLTYNISLPYGTTEIPVITYQLAEEWQSVSLQTTDWTALLTVTAADRSTTLTYTLNFSVLRSDNAFLADITLDGKPLEGFQPEVSEYVVTLPYGTEQLPEVGYTLANEQQQVDAQTTDNVVVLTVTSGNGEETSEYIITFTIELSPVNTLSDLAVNGVTVEGFAPDVQEYVITYDPDATTADFFTAEAVTYTLTDPAATAVVQTQDEATIMVMVTAANGTTNAYVIRQVIALNNNALLNDLLLDGVTIPDFDPEVFDYDFALYEGAIMPFVTAVSQDTTADVSVTLGQIGDTTYIYCTALDGTEEVYTVYIHYSDINTTLAANENSVILKHIPGTNQFLAATIRQNVQIGIFDAAGRRVLLQDVPLCDPNMAEVITDAMGVDVLNNITVDSAGAIITLDHLAQTYYYVFFQDGKRRISSGKLMLVR